MKAFLILGGYGNAGRDGGFHPGLPAAMIRRVCDRDPDKSTTDAQVFGLIALDWKSLAITLSEETMEEFAMELKEFDSTVFQGGNLDRLGRLSLHKPNRC